jgi:dihydrofolate synthase / folylpolyglutamate synthase
MTLHELLPWLVSRTTGGIRWGLERTEELLAGVGDPHRHFRALHIGGTNGKGSVAALCDAALRAGASVGPVGLYTSPHLVHFRERVRVDGVPVADEVLAAAAERLRPAIERTGASFFEATTAIAFLCFAEAGVRTAVVEVGLGGRLDATNVVDPLVSGVTNVGMDHTEYLGREIEAIAAEKAGIFRSGVPAVTASSGAALEALHRAAERVGTPLHELDDRVRVLSSEPIGGGRHVKLHSRAWGGRELTVPLAGEHQAVNALLAAELLGLLPSGLRPAWDAVVRGFAAVRWPGRLQVERRAGTTWVLDVAHNPDGARALATALDGMALPRPLALLVSVLGDKAWEEMLPPLVERSDAVLLTVPDSAPQGRVWDPERVAAWLAERGVRQPVRVVPSLEAAVQRASTLAPHGTVVVTGSVHTVGDAMRVLEIPTL